jgi:hypothetical protein
MTRRFVRSLSAPRGRLERDYGSVRTEFETQMIGARHAPPLRAMLIEAKLVVRVCNAQRNGPTPLCRIGSKHALVWLNAAQEDALKIDRRCR